MSFEIRAVDAGEVDALLLADRQGFGQPPMREGMSRSWAEGELDRTRAVFDRGRIVGTSRTYSFELTLPGGALVPVAAVSWVSVVPTHRRRGVLTQMIAALHDDARARGEVAGILTASEAPIYGRFGYGAATWRLAIEASRADVQFRTDAPPDDGRIRLVSRSDVDGALPAAYDRIRVARPGMVTRPAFWWPQVYWDQLARPDGAEFLAVHEDSAGAVDGFVAYDISGEWLRGTADRRLHVWDLQAASPATHAALWRYVFGVDLVATVAASLLAPDDPLRLLVTDLRRVRVDFLNDGLWLCPFDVPALLAARSYGADGALVIEVADPSGGSASFALEGSPEGATCVPTTASPDVRCDVATLGALLLGGNRWGAFARAGRVDEMRAGACARADRMFATDPLPAMLSYF